MGTRRIYTLGQAGCQGLPGAGGGRRGRAELAPDEAVRHLDVQERREGLGSLDGGGPQHPTPRW
eukprot:5379160-Pyramimonas_sp.AAC.1